MIFTFLFGLSSAYAVPVQLGQQGRLLDSSGAAINGSHLLSFRIAESGSSTNFLWEESLTVSFQDGYYSAVLGANNASNPLDDSILQSTPLFLEIEVDANGPLTPRQEITSTPFSRLAGSAQNLLGGTADASELKIGGVLVIDGAGSWVGPTMITNWVDITGLPADIADGDDDTLAGISCQTGQILGWNGSAWGCTDDNGLTESEVEAFVTNGPLDLAVGSMVGGDDIVTTATDQDSFADLALSCQNGDVAKYDSVLGWQCGLDSDTNDWNSLQNIPADLADGDDVLTEGDVETFVTNGALNLSSSTTLNGNTILTSADSTIGNVVCGQGEVLSYDLGAWTCTSFQALLDTDGDGVMAWNDCDDNDPSAGTNANDQDCDGTVSSQDCNDYDPNSETIATDADCDGVLTADDCDDTDASLLSIYDDGDCDGVLAALDCDDGDASLLAITDDADCDGFLTADDCDDSDSSSSNLSNDADCDGFVTAADCDDSDPSSTYVGGNSTCPALSCSEIYAAAGGTLGDGTYWIDPDGSGGDSSWAAHCLMSVEGGGWTRVLNLSNEGDYQSIESVSNGTEVVNNNSWAFSKTLLKESSREVLIYETISPHRLHRYDFKQYNSASAEDFVGIVTGDLGVSGAVWNYSTNSWEQHANGQCNTNNHSQWNCQPANGVRFHYATRDWTGDGGSSYGDGSWCFTGYVSGYNNSQLVKNWNGSYDKTPHAIYIR